MKDILGQKSAKEIKKELNAYKELIKVLRSDLAVAEIDTVLLERKYSSASKLAKKYDTPEARFVEEYRAEEYDNAKEKEKSIYNRIQAITGIIICLEAQLKGCE